MKITIDLELSPLQKKIVRGGVVAGAVMGALGVGLAIAAPIDTTWVVDQKPLSATALKGDLDGLQAQVTALQAARAQETADGGYSLGAAYCGSSPVTTGAITSGPLSGYAAARKICQGVAGCGVGAHMCTGDEIARTASLSIAGPASNGWYSGSTRFPDSNVVNNCSGWTDGAGTHGGPVVQAPTWDPSALLCNTSAPILCCN